MDVKEIVMVASALLDALAAALAVWREARSIRRARESPGPKGRHFAPKDE